MSRTWYFLAFLSCLILGFSGLFVSQSLLEELRDFKLITPKDSKNFSTESIPYKTIGLSPSPPVRSLEERISATNKQYTVEIAVYEDEKQARAMIKRLASDNIDSFYTPFNQGGRVIYRVRSGMFVDKANSIAHRRLIRTTAKLKGLVRQL